MSDVRTVVADHLRPILFVAGVGLTVLGAVGPGPVGPVSVLGIITLLSAALLASPLAELLRTDVDPETAAPVTGLRERYVAGELGEEEFERRMEAVLTDEHDAVSADYGTVADSSVAELEPQSE